MNVESNSSSEASSHSSQNNKFVCNLCSVTFTRRNNLRTHEKKFHNVNYLKCNQACPLCDEKCRRISDLHEHIETKHRDVSLHFEEKIFHQESDFKKWKAEFERETVSSFVLSFSEGKEGSKVRHYRCHRSGAPEVKQSMKKKRPKKTGSIKIGVICPAFIKAENEDSTIIVKYQSTHVGHECEVRKLKLQKEERLHIASMLSSGLPIDVVVDRTKAESSPTKRVGLITRQDIYNIVRDFKIKNAVHKDDSMAVDITVKKMTQEDNNPVLLHKPRRQKQLNRRKMDPNDQRFTARQDMYNVAQDLNSNNAVHKDDLMAVDIIVKEMKQEDNNAVLLHKPQGQKQLKRRKMDPNDQRSECQQMLESLSERIKGVKSADSFQYIKESLRSIHAYLDGMENP